MIDKTRSQKIREAVGTIVNSFDDANMMPPSEDTVLKLIEAALGENLAPPTIASFEVGDIFYSKQDETSVVILRISEFHLNGTFQKEDNKVWFLGGLQKTLMPYSNQFMNKDGVLDFLNRREYYFMGRLVIP